MAPIRFDNLCIDLSQSDFFNDNLSSNTTKTTMNVIKVNAKLQGSIESNQKNSRVLHHLIAIKQIYCDVGNAVYS